MPNFHATVSTAQAEKRLLALSEAVDKDIDSMTRSLADEAVFLFQAFAPKGKTGRLGRGIRVVAGQARAIASGRFTSNLTFAVIAEAKAPSGYDYVGVTRFGTRTKDIRPTQGQKALQPRGLTIKTRRGIKNVYWDHTTGVTVAHDWAQPAIAAMNRQVDKESAALARRIELRFG